MSRYVQAPPHKIYLTKKSKQWLKPPKDGFAMFFIDVLESDEWKSFGASERRIYYALACLHFRHHQKCNGELTLSYTDFERLGVPNRTISRSLNRLDAGGFVKRIRLPFGDPLLSNQYLLRHHAGASPKTTKRRFAWIPLSVLESSEWMNLSIQALKAMDRLLIENLNNLQRLNGRLRVSYGQFVEFGISRKDIKGALAELIEARLIVVVRLDKQGLLQPPNFYRITFHGTTAGPATWRPSDAIRLPLKRKPTNSGFQGMRAEKIEGIDCHAVHSWRYYGHLGN